MIDEDTFNLAQEIKHKRNEKAYRKNKEKYNYIFGSFMECGDCGYTVSGMNLRRTPVISRGYNCTMYMKYGNKHCTNHSIKEEKVLFFFKEFLKDVKEKYEEYINSITSKKKKNNIQTSLKKYKKSLNIANEEMKLLLILKIKDIMKESNVEYRQIIENSYIEIEEEKKKTILELNKKVNEFEKINNEEVEKNIKSNIEIFDLIINSERPNRKYLEMILDRIIVYSDRNLEFKLKVNIDKLTFNDR